MKDSNNLKKPNPLRWFLNIKNKRPPATSGVKSLALSMALTFSTLFLAAYNQEAQASGMQNQLNKMFDSMVHTTSPGVYNTQRRGVLYGGRFTIKNKIFDESLISFVPPSFSGSCNGIDIFGGSFSFISKEQFIQLLRQIAANAPGYAFQLALNQICPECTKFMNSLQERIQALNQYMGNSCQLAQGIVNDTWNAFATKKVEGESFLAMTDKMVSTVFDTKFLEKDPPGKTIEKHGKDGDLIGNIVWKMLKKHKVNTWYSGGNDELLEAIMTLTGSIIVHKYEQAPDDATKEQRRYSTLVGYKIRLQNFVDGGDVDVYSCDGDKEHCIIPSGSPDKRIKLIGLKQQILDAFLGKGTSIGIINKINTGLALNETEQRIMASMPQMAGALIRRLAMRAPDSAKGFINELAGTIASEMAMNVTREMIRSARQALSNTDDTWAEKAFGEIDLAMERIEAEYNQLTQQYGSLGSKMQMYHNLMQATEAFNYLNLEDLYRR